MVTLILKDLWPSLMPLSWHYSSTRTHQHQCGRGSGSSDLRALTCMLSGFPLAGDHGEDFISCYLFKNCLTDANRVLIGTSEQYVQHGDADVFGAPLFVLHRAAELLRCLDDALLPVLWRQHLHCRRAGQHWIHTHIQHNHLLLPMTKVVTNIVPSVNLMLHLELNNVEQPYDGRVNSHFHSIWTFVLQKKNFKRFEVISSKIFRKNYVRHVVTSLNQVDYWSLHFASAYI